jgi:hypothetical protein
MGVREGPSMIKQRRRVKRIATFEERLAQEALGFKEAADKQPNGSQPRELLLRQAETGSNIDKWLSSPGLRPRGTEKSVCEVRGPR